MISKNQNEEKTYQDSLCLLLCFNILLFFMGDVANTLSRCFDWGFWRFTGVSKIIGICSILIYIVVYRIYRKNYVVNLFLSLAILTSCFLLSNLFLKNIDFIENIKSNLIYYLSACFLPILLVPFFSINKITTLKALQLVQFLFWLNAIFIVIGFCFEIKWFNTYYYKSPRFGYKGLLERSTYVSYLFIFMIIYYYYNWRVKLNAKYFLYLVLSILIALLVGTKRLYFCLPLLFVFHVYDVKLYKRLSFFIAGFLTLTGIYIFRDSIINGLSSRFSVFQTIYHDQGLVSAITSFRSDLLVEYKLRFIEVHWSFLSYFFGGGFFHLVRPEMDIIDAYLFFGVFGPLTYLYLFKKYIFNYKIKNTIVMFLLVLIVILAFFSSGVIFSADFAIPLILFSSYFYYEQKIIK